MKKSLVLVLFLFSIQPVYSKNIDYEKEKPKVKPVTFKFKTNINYINTLNYHMYSFLNDYGVNINYYLGNNFSWGVGAGIQPREFRGSIALPYISGNARYYFLEPIDFSCYTQTELIVGLYPAIKQTLGLEKRFSNGFTIDIDTGFNFLFPNETQLFPSVSISIGYSYTPLKYKNTNEK